MKSETERNSSSSAEKRLEVNNLLVDQNEQIVACLGSGFIKNFLTTGSIKRGFSIVTDKRVYFRGKAFEKANSKWEKVNVESIVDLGDVAGTGYEHTWDLHILSVALRSFLGMAVLALLVYLNRNYDGERTIVSVVLLLCALGALISLVFGIINVIAFFIERIDLFVITFAGGKISFDTVWYPEAEVREFQNQLRIAKDVFVSKTSRPVFLDNKESGGANSDTIEKLRDAAELFNQGLITEDEFIRLKQQLIK